MTFRERTKRLQRTPLSEDENEWRTVAFDKWFQEDDRAAYMTPSERARWWLAKGETMVRRSMHCRRLVFGLVGGLVFLMVGCRDPNQPSAEQTSVSVKTAMSRRSQSNRSLQSVKTRKDLSRIGAGAAVDSVSFTASDYTTPTMIVTGRTVGMDQKPVGDALIRVVRMTAYGLAQTMFEDRATTRSRADGSFEMRLPAERSNRLIASAPGMKSAVIVLTDGNEIPRAGVDDRRFTQDRILVLRPVAHVGGTVLLPDGRPAAGAVVRWIDWRYFDPRGWRILLNRPLLQWGGMDRSR